MHEAFHPLHKWYINIVSVICNIIPVILSCNFIVISILQHILQLLFVTTGFPMMASACACRRQRTVLTTHNGLSIGLVHSPSHRAILKIHCLNGLSGTCSSLSLILFVSYCNWPLKIKSKEEKVWRFEVDIYRPGSHRSQQVDEVDAVWLCHGPHAWQESNGA